MLLEPATCAGLKKTVGSTCLLGKCWSTDRSTQLTKNISVLMEFENFLDLTGKLLITVGNAVGASQQVTSQFNTLCVNNAVKVIQTAAQTTVAITAPALETAMDSDVKSAAPVVKTALAAAEAATAATATTTTIENAAKAAPIAIIRSAGQATIENAGAVAPTAIQQVIDSATRHAGSIDTNSTTVGVVALGSIATVGVVGAIATKQQKKRSKIENIQREIGKLDQDIKKLDQKIGKEKKKLGKLANIEKINDKIVVVLMGHCGVGKSTICNRLIGDRTIDGDTGANKFVFKTDGKAKAVTKEIQFSIVTVNNAYDYCDSEGKNECIDLIGNNGKNRNNQIVVVDTPGAYDTGILY